MANGTQVGRYLIGRNVSLMACGAMYIDAYGNLTPGGDFVDLHSAGTFKTFSLALDFGLERIEPTDAVIANNVATVANFEFTVGEIQGPGGYSKLGAIGKFQSSYFGVEAVTYDQATGQYAQTSIIGIYQNMREGIVRGENVVEAVFIPCGITPYFGFQFGSGSGSGVAPTSGGLNNGYVRVPHTVTSQHP